MLVEDERELYIPQVSLFKALPTTTLGPVKLMQRMHTSALLTKPGLDSVDVDDKRTAML